MKSVELASDLGFVFEDGFTTGVLSFLSEVGLGVDCYDDYLKEISVDSIAKTIIARRKIVNEDRKPVLRDWVNYTLELGYLRGSSFIREFLEQLGYYPNPAKKGVSVRYMQACFLGDNAFKSCLPEEMQDYKLQMVSRQMNLQANYDRDSARGEWLNADCLIFLDRDKTNKRLERIEQVLLVIDLSTFSLRSLFEFVSPYTSAAIDNAVAKAYSYEAGKTIFSQINFDLDADLTNNDNSIELLSVSEDLKNYLNNLKIDLSGMQEGNIVFDKSDRELAKAIQACSYAGSFLKFLSENQKIGDNLSIHCLGITDRSQSSISGQFHHSDFVDFLDLCNEIYRDKKKLKSQHDRSNAIYKYLVRVRTRNEEILGQGAYKFSKQIYNYLQGDKK